VSVAGGRLNQRRLRNARAILRGDELFDTDRPILRPGRLMSADRRPRIARRIGRDDMRMNVDDQDEEL
jgi:hypothetical protein